MATERDILTSERVLMEPHNKAEYQSLRRSFPARFRFDDEAFLERLLLCPLRLVGPVGVKIGLIGRNELGHQTQRL